MRLRRAWPSLSLVLALAGLACASPAAPATAPPPAPTATPPGSASATPPGSASASAQTVSLSGLAFQPTTIQVKVGSQVVYQNRDQVGHTVTNGENGVPAAGAAFDQQVAAGASVTITFDKAGTVHVTCKIHPTMNQTVDVTP